MSLQDILRQLRFAPSAALLSRSFDRPNLSYACLRKSASDPPRQLATLVSSHFPFPAAGIIYCLSKKEAEATAELLREPPWRDVPPATALCYHAGLTPAQRCAAQIKWQAGEVRVICATVAFGMGIDKPDVVSE